MRTDDERCIFSQVPTVELLAGLAEEASELAQAALKFRRRLDSTAKVFNPTDKLYDECLENLQEEVADVLLYLKVIDIYSDDPKVISHMNNKTSRWIRRLNNK